MPTRLSLLFLVVVVVPVVAAQGPLTSSLVFDPASSATTSTIRTTIRTTVTVTLTSRQPPTTVTLASSTTTTTTTLFVPSSPPETITTTVYSDPSPSSSSSSSQHPSNVSTPTPSGSLAPSPTISSSSLARNPGALAGLIIGLCLVVAGLLVFAWFTIKRHRLRELEIQALDPSPIGGTRHSVSVADLPPGNGHSRIIDDDPDLEIQSSVEHEMPSSSIGHAGIISSFSGAVGPEESPEQRVDYESGYLATYPTAASSNGHSSHGHGTVTRNSSHGHGTITRNSSLTQINVSSSRNASPTLSRKTPNRARFSLSPDRVPSAWHNSRSEAPTRRGSIDDMSAPYNPHRVNSDPVIFHDAPQSMSIYPRRLSSEIPRLDLFPRPGPPILVHTAPQRPPSSLLRPPSTTQIPTLQTLQRSQPSGVYLDLPIVNEPIPSPAASYISVLSGREGLLGTPPHHPTESLSSLRDDHDYSRPIVSAGVVSALRDGVSMTEADSDSEKHPNRDLTPRPSGLG